MTPMQYSCQKKIVCVCIKFILNSDKALDLTTIFIKIIIMIMIIEGHVKLQSAISRMREFLQNK